jgi:ketosteroid isomerase-like protein
MLDPEVVIFEAGGAEFSRKEYLAGHARSDAEFLAAAQVKPGRRAARVSGDLAWVASLAQIGTERDGKTITVDAAETMLLRRGSDGWRIVHIHWSSRTRR